MSYGKLKADWVARLVLAVLLAVSLLTVSAGVGALYLRAAWAFLIYIGLVLLLNGGLAWLQATLMEPKRGMAFRASGALAALIPTFVVVYFPLILLTEIRVPLGAGVFLCTIGLARVAASYQRPHPSRTVVALAGLVTAATGAIILLCWPSVNIRDIALIVTFDILLQGAVSYYSMRRD